MRCQPLERLSCARRSPACAGLFAILLHLDLLQPTSRSSRSLRNTRAKNEQDRAQRDASGLRHGADGPVRRLARRLAAGQRHNLSDDVGGCLAGLSCLVAQQAVYPLLGKYIA
jgi:hypothetical protein